MSKLKLSRKPVPSESEINQESTRAKPASTQPIEHQELAHINHYYPTVEALIRRIHAAVKEGLIPEYFTCHDVQAWVDKYDIRRIGNLRYQKGYIATLLSTSVKGRKPTKNRNSKWLNCQFDKKLGLNVYWFDDEEE